MVKKRLSVAIFFSLFLAVPRLLASNNSNASLLKEWKQVDGKIRNISVRETELINQKLELELALSETTENIKILTEVIINKRGLILNRIRYLNQDSGSNHPTLESLNAIMHSFF